MPLDTTKPFTHRAARQAGIARHRLASPQFSRLARGVYVDASVTLDGSTWARAALLSARGEASVSHHTAAALWGGVVPHTDKLHLSVPRGVRRAARDDVVVHASSRTPTVFRGLRTTGADDTFLDLARSLGLVDLVVLGDSLVRRRRTTPEKLVQAAGTASGRGVALARRAATLVRPGVDSPMEIRCRLLRVLAGLPELETDIRFHDDRGTLTRRLDAGDRRTRTGVEYDGRHHVRREEKWEDDIGRREEFEDQDWRIVTLVSRDVFVTPARTVERLRRILSARGMTVGPPRHEWLRHFPGRDH
ncbi:hypothetical protein ACQE98_04375 [Ornithinimicrobium sp. W1679]|uniref:hypothetical protein n=1 Tax=Ornithinimicrobium sp. W1679 TaxID=3418770 RepID=UPI003CE6B390